MKTLLRLSLLLAVTIALTACNTVRGVGEDLSAVGNTLARTGN
jgi:predicted small secreted protein